MTELEKIYCGGGGGGGASRVSLTHLLNFLAAVSVAHKRSVHVFQFHNLRKAAREKMNEVSSTTTNKKKSEKQMTKMKTKSNTKTKKK